MPERDLVIATVLAALLHCSVALVRAPALQQISFPEDRPLAISIVSDYKRNPELSGAAVHETTKGESKETDDREEVVLKKKAEAPAEEREDATALPEGAPAAILESPPPLEAEPNTGGWAEKIVTQPAIPCYKSNPPPKYPEIARRRGYEGEVLLSVKISVGGTVVALQVRESSGYPILDRAAVKAVAAWEFEPARRMGIPVPLSVDIPVRFMLRRP